MLTADAHETFSFVELPAVIVKRSKTAQHNVIGMQCNLEVHYEWGAAALQIK